MRGKRCKGNAVSTSKGEEKKTNAWQDRNQDASSATKMEKLNGVVVIVTPLIMLAFNLVYFFLTTSSDADYSSRQT